MEIYANNSQNGIFSVDELDVIKVLRNQYGYGDKIKAGTEKVVTSIVAKLNGVEVNQENPLLLAKGEEKTIIIVPTTTEREDGIGYVEIDGKNYEIIFNESEIILNELDELNEVPTTTNQLIIENNNILQYVEATPIENELEVIITAKNTANTENVIINYGGKSTIVPVQIKEKYSVTVESNDNNRGTAAIIEASEDSTYVEGSTISLQAMSNKGYYLDGWYNGKVKISEENTLNYIVGTGNVSIVANFLKYGKDVDLGIVTANGEIMASRWKYFLEDTTNIYLMYGDYLENAQIPTATNIIKSGYCVYGKSGASRDVLVNYLKGETSTYSSTWTKINEAVKAAVKTKLRESGETEENAEIAVSRILTKGTPTPEQLITSYNENYGTYFEARNFTYKGQKFYTYKYDGTVNTSSTGTTIATGYLYTLDGRESEIKWMKTLDFRRYDFPLNGNTNMYFPHARSSGANNFGNCYGYWLAGTSAGGENHVCFVQDVGDIQFYSATEKNSGVCPIITIPKMEYIDIKSAIGIE